MWVKELSENAGEIDSLPFFTWEYKFRDIVEFNPDTGGVVRLIQEGGYAPTEPVKYSGDYQRERAKWQVRGYEVEGFQQGLMGVTRRLLSRK
jgi:hypothetical protein